MKIVILTGAGVSAESGVKTFRDDGGLWQGFRLEEVATPGAFHLNPGRVHEFYNQRRGQLQDVHPNAAHLALAKLERHFGEDFLLITQNVDDLHERAGSRRLLHLHGELLKKRCEGCGEVSLCHGDLSSGDRCDSCDAIGRMRPDIVWFGELPFHLEEIGATLMQADLFVAIGTSGLVYPAAGFSQLASEAGAKTIEVNLEETAVSPVFDERLEGSAVNVVPAWVDRLIAG